MYLSRAPRQPDSRLVRLVMRLSGGLLKDETQANYALLTFAVILLTLTMYMLARPSTHTGPPALSDRAYKALMQRDAQSRPPNRY